MAEVRPPTVSVRVMLEIAKLNGETSNNSIKLAAATLAISITKLVATAFAVLVIAAPLKLTAFIVPIIATPFKRSAYKVTGGCVASSAS